MRSSARLRLRKVFICTSKNSLLFFLSPKTQICAQQSLLLAACSDGVRLIAEAVRSSMEPSAFGHTIGVNIRSTNLRLIVPSKLELAVTGLSRWTSASRASYSTSLYRGHWPVRLGINHDLPTFPFETRRWRRLGWLGCRHAWAWGGSDGHATVGNFEHRRFAAQPDSPESTAVLTVLNSANHDWMASSSLVGSGACA